MASKVDATKTVPYHPKMPEHRVWDPLVAFPDTPTRSCLMRIQNDIRNIYADPVPGILVVPDEGEMCLAHALICGPEATPYEGGFFYFLVRFPTNYPIEPPRVRVMTTGGGTVRFNPNLYSNGKVCLSTLGTWSGPPWSPAQTLSSVLISIQSLLNEKPYHNEPGFHKEHHEGDSERYNLYLRHETLRVAVCNNVESKDRLAQRFMPTKLKMAMLSFFMDYYDHYISVCDRDIGSDGQRMHDPFHNLDGCQVFSFSQLKERLGQLRPWVETEMARLTAAENALSDDDDCPSGGFKSKQLLKKRQHTEEDDSLVDDIDYVEDVEEDEEDDVVISVKEHDAAKE